MFDVLIELFCVFVLWFISASPFMGAGSYTDCLIERHGNPIKYKYLDKHPEYKQPLWRRPFREKYESRYPIGAEKRNRFLYFLWLTRIEAVFSYVVICYIFLNWIFKFIPSLSSFYINIIEWQVMWSALCIISCVPFGYIQTWSTSGEWYDW